MTDDEVIEYLRAMITTVRSSSEWSSTWNEEKRTVRDSNITPQRTAALCDWDHERLFRVKTLAGSRMRDADNQFDQVELRFVFDALREAMAVALDRLDRP